MSDLASDLEERVRQRAGERCEYCQLPAAFSSTPFEVEHIVAAQHGGPTALGNLAWACFACNRHKGPNLGGIDPKTGKKTWLFHPRRMKWPRHFRWKGGNYGSQCRRADHGGRAGDQSTSSRGAACGTAGRGLLPGG